MDQQPADNSSKKILIVEDDAILGEIYLRRLQQEGFDTQLVANGQEAPAAAEKYLPDLILLDLMLPGMNGMDVLDALRKSDITKDAKIFIFSALSEEGLIRDHDNERERFVNAGADEYLVKSRDLLNDVIAKIKKALGAAETVPSQKS